MDDNNESLDGNATAQTPTLGVTPAVLYGRSISALLVGLAYGEARALEVTGRTPSRSVLRSRRCRVGSPGPRMRRW